MFEISFKCIFWLSLYSILNVIQPFFIAFHSPKILWDDFSCFPFNAELVNIFVPKKNQLNDQTRYAFQKTERVDENLMLVRKFVWAEKNDILFRSGLFLLSIYSFISNIIFFSFVFFVVFILDLLYASNFISFALLLSSFYHSSKTNWHNGILTVNKFILVVYVS